MLRKIIWSWPVGFLFLLGFAGAAVAGAPGEESDSVYSWGRWETLAPAAGGVPDVSALQLETGVELRPGDAAVLTPGLRSDPPGDGGSEPPAQVEEPVVVPNPPDSAPPVGDPRTSSLGAGEPVLSDPSAPVLLSGGPRG